MTEYETMWYGESMWWRGTIDWRYKFCWFPKHCAITGKRLWLRMAYCGHRMTTGPGNPIVEYRWHDVNEHLIWLLKS